MESDIYKEAKRIIEEVPEIISTEKDTQDYVKSSQWYKDLEKEPHRIDAYVGFIEQLINSLKSSQQNLTTDNPFLNVKGSYNFFIDTSKSGTEKIEYIHKKIIDYLLEKQGKLFFFKPGDNSKVYVVNEPHSYQVSRLIKDAPNEIKKLVTQYPQTKKSKVTIKISTDPLDIVKKSTHQDWSSCETIGGMYCQGVFSDIANNNAIAYIHLDDNSKPTGRFMLRWCEKIDEITGQKKKDIGIEPIMYPRTSYALEIYELIRGIIESHGYGTYDDCKTPYKYTGYSDYIGGSGEIMYHSGAGSHVLIQYASLPDISRNLALALAEHTTPTEVRRALAENSAICEIEDVMNKLSKDIDEDTKKNLIITCSGLDWDETERKMPTTALDNLINDESEDIRAVIASRGNFTLEQVRKLSDDIQPYVRIELARNKVIKCCQDVIDKLALDGNDDVSNETIRKYGEDLSSETIHRIVDYGKEDRLVYINNLGKYPEIVKSLASNKSKYIREAVASKEYIKCCPDVIDKLADNGEGVAVKLLDNKVAQHKRKYVMDRLNKLINTTEHYFAIPDIARQPDICDYKGMIDNLLQYIDDTTKSNGLSRQQAEEKLAGNPSISCRPDVIKKISQSRYVEPKRLLTENPAIASSPETIRDFWYKDDVNEYEYKSKLVGNPAIEEVPDILKKVLNDLTYTNKQSYLHSRLVSNPVILKRRDLSEEFIQKNKSVIIEDNKDVFKHDDLMKEAMSSLENMARLGSNSYIVNYPDVVNKLYDTIINWNKPEKGYAYETLATDSYKRNALSNLGNSLKHRGVLDQEILKQEPIKGLDTVSGERIEYFHQIKQKYKDIIDKIEAHLGHPIYA